jgi:CubicO group peptidase (beta-lactamase class C family)
MRRHFLVMWMIVTAAVASIATLAFAQDTARMEQIVESYVKSRSFMGAVLVARGADVVFSRSYGSANLEWDIPNTLSTKFRLGSITKQFTAASILLLEERGHLSTGDSIAKYVRDAPPDWERITLFHILTHTSGLPDLTRRPDYRALLLTSTPLATVIAALREQPLEFTPGEKVSYNNAGYVLLGYVIEKASGVTYERFVQDNLFTPLGMKDSGYDSNVAIIPRRASGYAPSPLGFINADHVHASVAHGAGALYSTTEDLLRWEQGLFGGKMLSAASLRKMTTPFRDEYALGVVVRSANGRRVVEQAGGIGGFSTFLAHYPDDRLTVAVLANVSGQAPSAIASSLATIALGGTVLTAAERVEISLPKEALRKFVGVYDMRPGVHLRIRLEGDRLTVQVDGGGFPLPLFAESQTRFFLRAVDVQIDFTTDASGEVTALVLHQDGRDITAPRTKTRDAG